MNKLQLYIFKAGLGRSIMVDINGDDNVRKRIADLTSLVKSVDYAADRKTVFYAVDYLSDGYVLHVIRTIPPHHGDHLDAAIFVGRDVDVMSDELYDVVERVTATVRASSVTADDMARLKELFSYEYDLLDKAPKVKAMHGEDPAFLHYDDERTLRDVVDAGLYTPDWSDYSAVLLLPDELAMNDEVEAEDLDADEEPEPEEQLSYVFELPMVTPEGRSRLEFEIETGKPMTGSPIRGYEVQGALVEGPEAVNKLRRGRSGWWQPMQWLWGMGGLIAGIICMSIVDACDHKTPQPPATAVEVNL